MYFVQTVAGAIRRLTDMDIMDMDVGENGCMTSSKCLYLLYALYGKSFCFGQFFSNEMDRLDSKGNLAEVTMKDYVLSFVESQHRC